MFVRFIQKESYAAHPNSRQSKRYRFNSGYSATHTWPQPSFVVAWNGLVLAKLLHELGSVHPNPVDAGPYDSMRDSMQGH